MGQMGSWEYRIGPDWYGMLGAVTDIKESENSDIRYIGQ